MRYLASPQFIVEVTDSAPHTISYTAAGPNGGLSPAGVAAVTSQASTYLTAAKVGALNAESLRFGGAATVPAARIGATHGEWPVSWADISTQVTALQSVIGTAGNANG